MIPILGVCLGHQCIGQAFGAKVVRAERIMHGKTSRIYHRSQGVFAGLPMPFEATRYHSLVLQEDSIPENLSVMAWCDYKDGHEIMGIKHNRFDIQGVQFHPESILTPCGHDLLNNFLQSLRSVADRNIEIMDIKQAIARVADSRDLALDEMKAVMGQIMRGEATDAQIGAFLMGLRLKGESLDEITGAVMVMRELASGVDVAAEHMVDIVGTGGDGANLFNVSTAACFVVAAAGGKVAKHGNRSVSSSSGSADLLESAGVVLGLTPEQVAACVEQVGVGFMFAPAHHSAMRHAIGPRKEMGVRTIFNILGPMTNPAGVKRLLIGVYDSGLCRPVARGAAIAWCRARHGGSFRRRSG